MIHNDIIELYYPIPDEKNPLQTAFDTSSKLLKELRPSSQLYDGSKSWTDQKSKLLSDPLENWIGETSKNSKILIDR